MIIFAELQMQGDKHLQVNSGLLRIFLNHFFEKKILVICDEKHKKGLVKKTPNIGRIIFQSFKFTGDNELNKKYIILKLVRETILAFKLFKTARRITCEVIIFASAFPFTAIFLRFFSKIFKQKIIVCQHGELGILTLHKNKFTTQIYRYVISSFFRNRNLNIIPIFFGESVKNKLFSLFPNFTKENIIVIDHPYEYNIFYNHRTLKNPIVFLNIGTGIITKKSHYIYELAKLCRENIEKDKIKFFQIGNISKEVLSYSNSLVKQLNKENSFMSTDVFENSLNNADYFIYFFTDNSLYDLCPSGTFFDAIKYQKPIVALHNPFFDYYFEKLGNIGYLCNNINEMAILLNNLSLNLNQHEYSLQLENLKKSSDLLSIESITQKFSEQYNKIV